MVRLTMIKLVTQGEGSINKFNIKVFLFRKSSCYSKQKVVKNVIKGTGKSGRKTWMGIKGKKKELDHADSQSEEYLVDDDQDTTIKDEDIVYYRARRLIPIAELKVGMGRFTFLLENCMPGTVPDPSLLASILELVNRELLHRTEGSSLLRKLALSLPGPPSSCTAPTLFMKLTGANSDCNNQNIIASNPSQYCSHFGGHKITQESY